MSESEVISTAIVENISSSTSESSGQDGISGTTAEKNYDGINNENNTSKEPSIESTLSPTLLQTDRTEESDPTVDSNDTQNNIISDSSSEVEEEISENQDKDVSDEVHMVSTNCQTDLEVSSEVKLSERDQDMEEDDVPPNNDIEEDRQQWELKKVMTHAELTARGRPKLCSTESCTLRAAFVYENSTDSDDKISLCLDCNVTMFERWPSQLMLSLQGMTDEQKLVMCAKCSQSKDESFFSNSSQCNIEVPKTTGNNSKETGHEHETSDIEMKNVDAKTDMASVNIIVPEDELSSLSHDEEENRKEDISKSASDDGDDDADDEELWEIQKVMTLAELTDGRRSKKCSNSKCKMIAAVVWYNVNNPKVTWNACLDCQEEEYGGWPDVSELPIKEMSQKHYETMLEKCTRRKGLKMPNIVKMESDDKDTLYEEEKEKDKDSSSDDKKVDKTEGKTDEDSSHDIAWDLFKIMPAKEVTCECPIKCFTDDCPRPAAVAYVSKADSNEKWYGCLDCQDDEFGGWPEVSELPLDYMTPEHMAALVDKCSKYKTVPMPDFSQKHGKKVGCIENDEMLSPHHGTASKSTNEAKAVVTPCTTDVQAITKVVATKPSKQMLETHRKWQEMAESMGGIGARIVVSKPEAKKLIYDELYDAFRPMNITDIYKMLKAKIPNIVLKTCLDDMVADNVNCKQFAESDDEDDSKTVRKSRVGKQYDFSLCLKAGKHPNSSLYYVDYNSATNGGCLESEAKNELVTALAKAESERDATLSKIETLNSETDKLLAQPKNDEATSLLESLEAKLAETKEELERVQNFVVNDKHKKQLQQKAFVMTAEWRKRRRLCLDFLTSMEENTDGTVSAKKCLAGDGQIDLESDEMVIKNATAFAKKKNSIGASRKNTKKAAVTGKKLACLADDAFIGVILDSQGCIERVYSNDD